MNILIFRRKLSVADKPRKSPEWLKIFGDVNADVDYEVGPVNIYRLTNLIADLQERVKLLEEQSK